MSSARITWEAAQTTSATMISQPSTAMAASRRRAQRSLAGEGSRRSDDCGAVVSIAIHPERGATRIMAGSAVSPAYGTVSQLAGQSGVRRRELPQRNTEGRGQRRRED